MSGQVYWADGPAGTGRDVARSAIAEMGPVSTPSGSIHLILGGDDALRAGLMMIPAACHAPHTPAMATPKVELLQHRIGLCRRQVLHVHAWKRGVKRFLGDGAGLAPCRKLGHEETHSQNEAGIKEQCGGRLSVELV